jgi:hypothetical protein
MKTASRFEIRLESAAPLPRRAFGLALMIVCAVAAVSFTLGLTR